MPHRGLKLVSSVSGCVRACVCVWSVGMRGYVCVCVCMLQRMCVYMYIYIYACMCEYIQEGYHVSDD